MCLISHSGAMCGASLVYEGPAECLRRTKLCKAEASVNTNQRWSSGMALHISSRFLRERKNFDAPGSHPRPPEWVQALVGKSASVSEFLAVLGARARDARTVEQRKELFTVFEQFAQWGEGRDAADLVLGPDFIYGLTDRLRTGLSPRRRVQGSGHHCLPSTSEWGPDVWLNPWQDEFVWPESELQPRFLDRRISKVWLNNWRPFVELFLFDGPDLQGRMARFARVWTPNADLPIELDGPSLRGQARSLLGGEFNTPGRRFSASAQLTQAAEQWLRKARWHLILTARRS